MEAVVHSCFTREELQELREEHISIFQAIDRESKAEEAKAAESGDNVFRHSVSLGGGTTNNGARIHNNNLNEDHSDSDDEMLDVPDSDCMQSERDDNRGDGMSESEDGDSGLNRVLFRRNANESSLNGNRYDCTTGSDCTPC